jgi:hypothetical protein
MPSSYQLRLWKQELFSSSVVHGDVRLRLNFEVDSDDMTFLPKSGDVDLERRVRRDLAFLFEEHGATVSANTLEAFGNSAIMVIAGNLEFKFAKNERDQEFRVVVAPRNGHGVWEPSPAWILFRVPGNGTHVVLAPGEGC